LILDESQRDTKSDEERTKEKDEPAILFGAVGGPPLALDEHVRSELRQTVFWRWLWLFVFIHVVVGNALAGVRLQETGCNAEQND
jgi:hypothetical protein